MSDFLAAEEAAPMCERIERAEAARSELRAARNDRWYPAFHIAAPAGWINDPNGLSHYQGRYQVYFQHNPFATEHDSMHWGHVSSSDLVTWRHEPIALAPSVEEDRDGVYSGSAVVSDEGELVVYFTGHRWRNGVDEEDGNLQVQCMAVSGDGVAFEKQGVVVECPEGLLHFRDPKVWRAGDTWYMIFGACSAENRGQIWLYTSRDMHNWEFDRVVFEDPDPDAFMLECPDMFPLPAPDGDKWVIAYCPMGPKPAGYLARNGHNAGYVVGDWEPGGVFHQLTDYRPIDWGHNFYAPQSFEAPDGRRVMIAWLGAFARTLAPQDEGDGWCGQLSLPRECVLDDDYRLRSTPVAEIDRLRLDTIDLGAFELGAGESRVLVEDGRAIEVELEVDLGSTTSERVGLNIHKTPDGCGTFVAYDDLARRVVIDQRNSRYGDRGYRGAPYPGGDRLGMRVFIDRGSIEVFVNGGRESLTSFSFAGEGPRAIELVSEAGTASVESLRLHRLGSIWEAG